MGFCGWIRCELTSENELDDEAGSRVTYKIFGLMLGIFRPSTALEAAVRFEASVKNYPFTGQCFEQLSFSPDREPRHCLLSHLYQNMGTDAVPHSPPCPSAPSQFTATETEKANWTRRESKWVIFL